MADEKNMPMPDGKGVDVPVEESNIDAKLKAAAGDIDRHHADSKQRESELERANKEKAKEERLRAKEAEQRSIDLHREAVLNAAAEQAAFEAQRKLRKKLERERRRKMEEERRLLAEEKKAREETRAREIAEALEKDKADTEARKAKSAELLNKLSFPEQSEDVAEEVSEATEIAELAPIAEELVEEPMVEEPEVEEIVAEETVEEEPEAETDAEELTEEPVAEEAEAVDENFEIDTEELAEEAEELEVDEKFEIDTEELTEEPEAEVWEAEESDGGFAIDTEELTKAPDAEEYESEVTIADIDVMVEDGDGKYLVHLKDGRYGYFTVGIDGVALIVPIEESQSPIVQELVAEPTNTQNLIKKIAPIVKSGKIKVSDIEPALTVRDNLMAAAPSRIKVPTPNLGAFEPFEEIYVEPEREVIERIPIGIYDTDRNRGKILLERPEDDEIPPLTFEDDLITSIKKQGEAVDDNYSYRQYIKRSEKAINSFYADINRIDKNIENVEDENDIPPMIVETVNIMGKIVAIRSNNLAVTARVQKQKTIEKYRSLLSSDIDNYNSRVAYFTKVTGSMLTRLSAFIPNSIIDGSGEPVIPILTYTNNYVEVFPDADGNLPESDDNVMTTVVVPLISFEEEIGNISPKNKNEANDFVNRVNKSKKKLLGTINAATRSIEKNARAKHMNLEKEEGAFTARDHDVTEIYATYTRRERKTPKCVRLLTSIDDRYRAVIVEAREVRAEKRYDEVDKELHVERLTAERERVVFTLEAIRSLRGVVTPKELNSLVASTVREMQIYNSMAEECGERIEKELTVVSGSLADDVMRTGEKFRFPLIVKRRELYERVGDVERLVGDKVKPDYLKTTKAERLKLIREMFSFDGDKTYSDRALMREDVRLRAIERLAEGVNDKKTFKAFYRKCRYAFREFERTLKQTDKAIFRARDEDGVIAAITENLRVMGRFIAAMSVLLECAVENEINRCRKKYMILLENLVERYNNRCADYRNITRGKQNGGRGYKLMNISSLLAEKLSGGEVSAVIPELSYRERYIECYPSSKEADGAYRDPAKRGCDYTPIDYNDRRYTENDMVEITVINSPICAVERMRSDQKAKGRKESRSEFWSAYFLTQVHMTGMRELTYYLRRAKRHKNRALRQERKFDKKLNKLIASYEKKTRKLNDRTPDLLRESLAYEKKMKQLDQKYNKKCIKLRYKRVKMGIERRILNYSVRELAIYREAVEVWILSLKRVRASSTRKWIGEIKRQLVMAVREHNEIANDLSIMLGKPIARISTSIADEIIRNHAAEYRLPKIAFCRETMESVGDSCRSIGDPYRHGMPYTINSQGIAVFTGTCRIAPGVACKWIGIDENMKPVIGSTNTGLSYAGVPNQKVLGVALSQPVSTSVTRAGSNSPVYGLGNELLEPKDELFSDIDTKPVSEEIKEINDYLIGAVSKRAEAVSTVFDYRHYTRRTRPVRRKVEKVYKATNKRFKKFDKQFHDIFVKAPDIDGYADNQGNLTEKFKKLLAREGIGDILAKSKKNIQTITKDELHSSIKKKELIKRRARVFQQYEEVRNVERCRFVFELRTLAALGRLVEIRCANLCAASKLQLTIPMQMKLGLLGLGINPKKKCRKKLTEAIEKYNNVHVSRAEGILGQEDMYDLSLIDTMLPEGLANREVLPDVPHLIYRDRFAEVVTTRITAEDAKDADREEDEICYVKRTVDTDYGKKGTVIQGMYIKQTERSDDEGDDEIEGKEPEVNLINSAIVPVMRYSLRDARFRTEEDRYIQILVALEKSRKGTTSALSHNEFEKRVKELIKKRYKKLIEKLDKVIKEKLDSAEGYSALSEKFVKKKLFALHRYEKAVFRISKITHETARYQRKMSRRLKMFRKRLYRLKMKEIQFGIVGGRFAVKKDMDARIPSMSFEEKRRRSAIEAMNLEHKRLVLAVFLCQIVHGKNASDKEFKKKSKLLAMARRRLTNSMIHYKITTAECNRILKTKKLWEPTMAWYKKVQNGDFENALSEVPRLVALRQLAELYDEIKPIDQRTTTPIVSPRA